METKLKIIRVIFALLVIIAATVIIGGLTKQGEMTARAWRRQTQGYAVMEEMQTSPAV